MADEQIVDDAPVKTDDKPVTDEDLRNLKYGKDGVEAKANEPSDPQEPAKPSDEPEAEEDDQITPEEEASPEATFTKQFPNIRGDTPEEYYRNVEIAYGHSFEELKKIRSEVPAPIPEAPKSEDGEAPTWYELRETQRLQDEAETAYADLTKPENYPILADQTSPEYAQFTKEVDSLSRTILASQGRLALPAELYRKAALIMDLQKSSEPSEDEKLGMAVKDGAAVSKTNSISKSAPKSKVTDQDITFFRKLNPTSELSDTEIRKELEPHK